MYLCKKYQDPKNIFYNISYNYNPKSDLKPLFIFDGLSWSNIVFLLYIVNINISGGSITHRHLLSTTHNDLYLYLNVLFSNKIKILRKYIYLSYKTVASKAGSKYWIHRMKENNNSLSGLDLDYEFMSVIDINTYLFKYLDIINELKIKIYNKNININDLNIDINQIEVIKNYLIVFFPYFTSQNSEIINLLDKVKSLIINS
uniref:RNA polymerase n=1 Tax=Hericium erinaceus TaxID=91752 RepID=UPI0021ABD804|nr:RNA polymerase [Hericium erinaceus]UUF93967.1 RNA polymerase [Hericium erinaceus]